jgi:acetolactate synthase regulatory subunit
MITPSATLYLTADADPTLLARVAGVLSILSLVPIRFSGEVIREDSLFVTIELSAASDRCIELLQRNLMRLPQCVELRLEQKLARIAC